MNNKLVIVTDLGQAKAFRLPCDLTKASTQEIIGHFLDKSISST